jgi:NitT/TauT family transport system ATP-binding protein
MNRTTSSRSGLAQSRGGAREGAGRKPMVRTDTLVPIESADRANAQMNTPAIALDSISKTFESRNGSVHALDSISLSIRNKEFVCIIGPSGCGKSTILGMIAGLTRPSAGSVTINGDSIEAARRAHQIGLVFQDAVLLPWRTVAENVSLPLEVLKLPRSDREGKVAAALGLVRLGGFERRFPHELSGGMRQRLGIARALSFDPQVLLMDEPFGALDAITRDKMSIELTRIWDQRQKTVIFVTHSISEAVFLSDRIVVMTPRPGRIAALVENPLPRPRLLDVRDSAEFLALSRKLRDILEQE